MVERKPPEFTGCRPVLPVADLEASVAYYVDVLGFQIGWALPDNPDSEEADQSPTLVYVFRGHFELLLEARKPPIHPVSIVVGMPSPEAVDTLAEEYAASGANVVELPEQREWGTYEMRVKDLDGHVLGILH